MLAGFALAMAGPLLAQAPGLPDDQASWDRAFNDDVDSRRAQTAKSALPVSRPIPSDVPPMDGDEISVPVSSNLWIWIVLVSSAWSTTVGGLVESRLPAMTLMPSDLPSAASVGELVKSGPADLGISFARVIAHFSNSSTVASNRSRLPWVAFPILNC